MYRPAVRLIPTLLRPVRSKVNSKSSWRMAARALKLVSPLRELRLHLCQRGEDSRGVREFIEKFYVPIKENNPKFPILIRECSGVQPKVYARYAAGREAHVSVSGYSADQVLGAIENLAKG